MSYSRLGIESEYARNVAVRILALPVIFLLMIASGIACGGETEKAGSTSTCQDSAPTQQADGRMEGLCFSPFLKQDPSASFPPEQVEPLLDTVAPYTKGIRTFSSTGIGAHIPSMAKSRGLLVAAGCDLSDDPSYNEAEVNGLVELARSGDVDIAVVGEETFYTGVLDEAQLIEFIRRVKDTGVATTTSQTWSHWLAHPRLMTECDIVMANMFPYWEDVGINDSVGHVNLSYQELKQAASGREVIVETGWPSDGEPRGEAVPSLENERWFLSNFMAWAQTNQIRYFYFEAFDEPWKASREGGVGAHWGIWDSDAKLKPGMEDVIGRE